MDYMFAADRSVWCYRTAQRLYRSEMLETAWRFNRRHSGIEKVFYRIDLFMILFVLSIIYQVRRLVLVDVILAPALIGAWVDPLVF